MIPNLGAEFGVSQESGRSAASENRGVISLLYVLLHTLKEEDKNRSGELMALDVPRLDRVCDDRAVAAHQAEDIGVNPDIPLACPQGDPALQLIRCPNLAHLGKD